jgi:hypothetical protein
MGRPRNTPEEARAARERKRNRDNLRYREKTAYARELCIAAGLPPRLLHRKPGPDRQHKGQKYLRIERLRLRLGWTKKAMAEWLSMEPNTLCQEIRRALKAAPIIRR